VKGWKETVKRKFRRKDAEDIISAIEADKYWKASSNGKYIYVLALTRARTKMFGDYWARCTALGRVMVNSEVRRFVKRYMVLLVDVEARRAVKVLTWAAFRRAMKLNIDPETLSPFSKAIRWTEPLKKKDDSGKVRK